MTGTIPPVKHEEEDSEAIGTLIHDRKIVELVHFTTNRGLLGILVEQLCKARALLDQDKYLESIYHANTRLRWEDARYQRCVNLSISEPNHRFLRKSSDDWWANEDLFWAVLSFDPVIMTHPGVLFAPSNMAYQGIVPVEGARAAEALFASSVPYGFGKTMQRRQKQPHQPTNPQAEVLYPEAVPTRYLQRIYVVTEDDAAKANAIVSASAHDEVDIIVDPASFGR
ncbi:DarT ssDNA thymidine ADP-ribosyltransferase family protein [Streptomyces sp. NPDC087300]|uniref:DarT ssDNA thymidine ADP-ribosyltransferase family protein n=1 Tax=Streptomyces sp. NPDC087300 TaxID=3365780 RepID=UPI0038156C57